MRQGEIVASKDHEQVSTILLMTIEGAIMMSKLYGTDVYLDRAIEHLHQYIDGLSMLKGDRPPTSSLTGYLNS